MNSFNYSTMKRARELNLAKINFANDFYHCRFCTLHKSTTIYNTVFGSGKIDL